MYKLYQRDGYRQLITLKCPPHMTKGKLKDWWLNKHAKRVRNLQGLRWYTVCFTFESVDYGDGSPVQPSPFDGYEELYFDSLDNLKKAYQSDIMKSSFDNMAERGLYNPKLLNGLWAEANVIMMKDLSSPPKQKGCYRIFGGCKLGPKMTKKDLKDFFYDHADRIIDKQGIIIIPEIIGYIHNFSLDDSPFGKPFVDAYCNNWWNSLAEMKKTFKGDVWKSQVQDREKHIDNYDKSLFVGALAEEYIIDI